MFLLCNVLKFNNLACFKSTHFSMILKKTSIKLLINILLISLCQGKNPEDLDGSSVTEVRGYPKREHSLIKPYQGTLILLIY